MGVKKLTSNTSTLIASIANASLTSISNTEVDDSIELVLTEKQLVALITSIFNTVNERISDRIVQVLDESSDKDHVVSADALRKILDDYRPGVDITSSTVQNIVEEAFNATTPDLSGD